MLGKGFRKVRRPARLQAIQLIDIENLANAKVWVNALAEL